MAPQNNPPQNTSPGSNLLVINQLHFRTNGHTIVPFLKTKADGSSGHSLFSFNSIVNLPHNLLAPLTDDILRLALLNIKLPILDEQLRTRIVADWQAAYSGKQPPAVIEAAVNSMRENGDGAQRDSLEQALTNYAIGGYFCRFDWCMDHWGTPEDVQEVREATFLQPTTMIEFATVATPPVLALQQLANIFPSVLFTLRYHYPPDGIWQEVHFHPFPPFGY